MQVRHEVHDGHLLARRVGFRRFYLYLLEMCDLLQLEGMRRGGERYDAAQHLVSESTLSFHPLQMQSGAALTAERSTASTARCDEPSCNDVDGNAMVASHSEAGCFANWSPRRRLGSVARRRICALQSTPAEAARPVLASVIDILVSDETDCHQRHFFAKDAVH